MILSITRFKYVLSYKNLIVLEPKTSAEKGCRTFSDCSTFEKCCDGICVFELSPCVPINSRQRPCSTDLDCSLAMRCCCDGYCDMGIGCC